MLADFVRVLYDPFERAYLRPRANKSYVAQLLTYQLFAREEIGRDAGI